VRRDRNSNLFQRRGFWLMKIIQALDRYWGYLLWSLMACAALYIGFIMLAIIYQTVF
jgi:hypothetical protein